MQANPGVGLADVRDALLALPHPFTRAAVHDVARDLRLNAADLRGCLNFSPGAYTRTRWYAGDRFEILVLCWLPGQASPIHDHARSICTMSIVQGVCRTEMFEVADGRPSESFHHGESAPLTATGIEECGAGRVITVEGGDIHRVGCPSDAAEPLVTVHFYLPPIVEMRCYDAATGQCRMSRPETLSPAFA